MRVNIKKISIVCLYMVYYIIINMIIYNIRTDEFDRWILMIGLIVIVNGSIQLMMFYKLDGRLFTLSNIFLILSYLFHIGHVYIYMGGETTKIVEQQGRIWFQYGVTYSLWAINSVVLGILVLKNKITGEFRSKKIEVRKSYYKELAILILIVCLPIRIYVDIMRLTIALSEGYLATYAIAIPNIIDIVAYNYITGIVLLLIYYKEDTHKARILLIVTMIYQCISMLSGHRAKAVITIIIILLIYYTYIEKIKFKRLILLIGVGYIGLTFITMLNTLRGFGYVQLESMQSLKELFIQTLEDNPIKIILNDFGGTIVTPILAMKQVPTMVAPGYGQSYIASFGSILINIGGIANKLSEGSNYVVLLDGFALGGSYIGELYYNFMNFGIILAPIIGMGVEWVSRKIVQIKYNKRYIELAFLVPVSTGVIWMIRDMFASLVRGTFYNALIVIGIHIIIKSIYRVRIKAINNRS